MIYCADCKKMVETDSEGSLTCEHGTGAIPTNPPVVPPTPDSDHDDETPSHDDLGVSGAG